MFNFDNWIAVRYLFHTQDTHVIHDMIWLSLAYTHLLYHIYASFSIWIWAGPKFILQVAMVPYEANI